MKRARPADPVLEPARTVNSAPGLAVTGLLMLLTILLMSNPFFGVKEELWPWEMFAQGMASVLVKVLFGIWVLTGFWCILLALIGPPRLRALVATALWAVLLIEGTGGNAGFTVEVFNFNNMATMISLGTGLWLARGPATRGLGRLLAGAGALLLLWAMVSGFPAAESARSGDTSQLQHYVQEMGALLRTGTPHSTAPNYLWWTLLPQTLILLGATAGLLSALGLTRRLFLTVSFYVLLAGLLMPAVVGATLMLYEHGGTRDVVEQITVNFVSHGLLLWLLGVFALSDLCSAGKEAA